MAAEGGGPAEPSAPPAFPGLVVLSPEGRVLAVDPLAAALTGEFPDTLDRPMTDLEPIRESGLGSAFADAVAGRKRVTLRGVRYRSTRTHRELLLDVEFVPLLDKDGAVRQVTALVGDSTRVMATRGRGDLFYQAFLGSSNAIEITDRTGAYVDVNPAFERIYGYPRSEILGRSPRILRSPKTPPELYRAMWRDLLDPAKGTWSGELINLDRSGNEHPVLLTIAAVRDANKELTDFVGVATDLTELRSLQLQSIRNERLLSLGQLAAGIAHELNTPLANIALIGDSIRRKVPDPWVRGRAQAIAEQVESAARITSGLLDFGRRHPPVVHDVDLAGVLDKAVDFVRGKRSASIEFRERHSVRPMRVRANRIQLEQVFVNLLNNAADAVEARDTSGNGSPLEGVVSVESSETDGWAEVAIRDSGIGIPPDVLPRIFEPFFTTKTDGKGTGLGLAICHGIVEAHGGEIRVRSEPGVGAEFVVRIPLDRRPDTSEPESTDPTRAPS